MLIAEFTLRHCLNLIPCFAQIQIMELACSQLVLLNLSSFLFGLQSCAHDVALFTGTVRMENLALLLHSTTVRHILWMLNGQDVRTIYSSVGFGNL